MSLHWLVSIKQVSTCFFKTTSGSIIVFMKATVTQFVIAKFMALCIRLWKTTLEFCLGIQIFVEEKLCTYRRGQPNWILDYGCSTAWKCSNFPGTPILREINFCRFQKVKNYSFNNFEVWISHLKNQVFKKNSELLKWSNWQFLGFKMTKIDFT